MKQIVVISGKGGTGKTTVAASFGALASNKVMVDCDVDAADLHILLQPKILERHQFIGGQIAHIDKDRCRDCGKCTEVCRFEAISDDLVVDPTSCEGCGLCSRVCPKHAITMTDTQSGEWFISETRYGPFVHGALGIAQENSGKLVSLLRQQALALAEKRHYDMIIIDGPPGTGCPVVASITGTDLVLIVTEPTLSGIHDMRRVVALAQHFHVAIAVAVNKYDLNMKMTENIERYCETHHLALAGKISYDPVVIRAMVDRQPLVEYSRANAALQARALWRAVDLQCDGGED